MSRVDQCLVDRGIVPSREKAKRAVMAGLVTINGRPAFKPSDKVFPSDELALKQQEQFVSRGGNKLEHALSHYGLDVAGANVADVGASTGGFTDCLLQRGVRQVYAIDVGHGQLAWKLRHDPRVKVMDRINARYLTRDDFPPPFEPLDLIVIDCSFISIKKLLSPSISLLRPFGRIIALIKPQFEVSRTEASKAKGVIKDSAIHQRVLSELEYFVVVELGLKWHGVTQTPVRRPAGNVEFLVLLEKTN